MNGYDSENHPKNPGQPFSNRRYRNTVSKHLKSDHTVLADIEGNDQLNLTFPIKLVKYPNNCMQ